MDKIIFDRYLKLALKKNSNDPHLKQILRDLEFGEEK